MPPGWRDSGPSSSVPRSRRSGRSSSFLRQLPDQPRLGFQPVPEPKTVKNRVHVDLVVDSMADTLAWIGANGGSTLAENVIGDFRWTTVADPEGNEFDVHE
jgi:predicted enzyme related to lactoylglutathione lyase